MNQWTGFGPGNVRADVGVSDATSSPGPASSVLTYEPYYGLKAKPFSLSTDPRSLYQSSSHAPVFEDLLAAIRRREGLIVLTGDIGTGKTTLCRAAIYQLDRKTFTTFVPDPDLSREDLLRMLLVGFGEVSVHDLKEGRLKGAPRADLGVQLYEFLTSLESVDAFAALVIDEAQNLSAPLLDEIRALSEMEAGRRLLQIVLVGQPELRARLRVRDMQQIAQRVTTVCELKPLNREGVAGYVAHRLAFVGGTRDRVEFSPQALDLVFGGSFGLPRLVNRICDRALSYGHLDRSPLIGQSHVERALQEVWMVPPRQELGRIGQEVTWREAPIEDASPAPVPPATGASPGGLFVKTSSDEPASSSNMDLTALLNLPAVPRRASDPGTPSTIDRPVATRRRPTRRNAWWRRALRSLSLPALGMGVMLFAGGIAVSTAGKGSPRVELPAFPSSPLLLTASPARPVVQSSQRVTNPAPGPEIATPAAASPEQTWVVQIAAFASQARSTAMVQHLTDQGWPAYQVDADSTARGLTIVRVGPYRTAGEADDVRTRLLVTPDYEGSFVRNITTQ
jgi:general secretion pathway protein A